MEMPLLCEKANRVLRAGHAINIMLGAQPKPVSGLFVKGKGLHNR
jgi:hypothetical protein